MYPNASVSVYPLRAERHTPPAAKLTRLEFAGMLEEFDAAPTDNSLPPKYLD
jgi:hypothetical protein